MIKKFLRALFCLALLLPSLALASPSQVDFLLSGMTDTNGQPLSGGKVYTYIAGTTTNKTTWTNYGETVAEANPIILDAYGRKQVFADGLYKFVVKTSADVTLYTWDNVYFSNYNGVLTYAGATTGSSNAYVATLSPALLSLTTGAQVTFVANFSNTAAATLNVNSLGAVSILRPDGTATIKNSILSGAIYTVTYNGSSWVLWNLADSDWTTWVPTLTGFSADPANASYRYQIINGGRNVRLSVTQSTAGTSNSTGFTISLPFTAKTVANHVWGAVPWSTTDNGSAQTTPAQAAINSAGTTVILAKSISGAGGGWTNANGKAASFDITYEPNF